MGKIVNKEEVKSMLCNLFMDELQGFTLSEPEVILIFNTSILDYVPGICIKATDSRETKYLIYSPLQMIINIFDEKPNLQPIEIGKKYHQGVLNASIITDKSKKEPEIFLYRDHIDGKLCKDASQADVLVKAFVAMSDILVQQNYFKIPGQDVVPVEIDTTVYWLKPHRGNFAFTVDVKNSKVFYRHRRSQNIKLLQKSGEYRGFKFNGKIFSL